MLSALVIFAGVPAVWLIGSLSDRIGRLKAIIMASLCSLIVQCTFGFLFGKPLNPLVWWGCGWDSGLSRIPESTRRD